MFSKQKLIRRYFCFTFLQISLMSVWEKQTRFWYLFQHSICWLTIQSSSPVHPFVTLWTVPGSSVHGLFQARITGTGCHFLLQGDPNLGIELASRALVADFKPLQHLGSPSLMQYVVLMYLKKSILTQVDVKVGPCRSLGDLQSLQTTLENPETSRLLKSWREDWGRVFSLSLSLLCTILFELPSSSPLPSSFSSVSNEVSHIWQCFHVEILLTHPLLDCQAEHG